MSSLEGRLHLGLALSLAVLISAAWALGHQSLHRSTEAHVLSRLRHDAEALLGALRSPARSDVHATGGLAMPIYGQPLSGHYSKVLIDDGRVLRSRSLWDQDIAVDPLPPGAVRQWTTSGPLGQRLLVRAAGYLLGNRTVTIAVAEDMQPVLGVLRGFERAFAALAVVGLGLMILIQRQIVQRTFRRLRPVYRDIDALERGKTRHLTEDVPAEIKPLVVKLNRLLAVYDKRLERSRNAAGNLAHAIKGPLNLMVHQLDRADSRLDAESRDLCRLQVQRVGELVERELKRARIAGGGTPGSVFDPEEELPVLRDLLLRMYPGKTLALDCRIEVPGPLAADREDMLELVGTLLDNACKWTARRVRCRLVRTGGGIRISVEDDGPGCSDEALAAIAERGARLDERVAGHGLGLAIAREIAELYQGRLELKRSDELGGLCAVAELPLSPQRPSSSPART